MSLMTPVDSIKFRAATHDDLDVLKYWDDQPHVIASDPNDDWNWEIELNRRVPWREQLIAELGGKPIGFVQIIDPTLEDSHYWGDVPRGLRAIDIWIGEKKYLGKGHGTEMMRQAVERCFSEREVQAIVVDPLADNRSAHAFYERLGFRCVDKRKFGSDDCFVYKLTREQWQIRE